MSDRLRCEWCGCFVRAGTKPSTHKARGVRNGILRWRRFWHLLCSDCEAQSQITTPWWKP